MLSTDLYNHGVAFTSDKPLGKTHWLLEQLLLSKDLLRSILIIIHQLPDHM